MSTAQARIYLDHNATTPVRDEAVEAMLPFFTAGFGNPSSRHAEGRLAAEGLARGREQVARLLGCSASSVVLLSGGTEADNMALFGAINSGAPRGSHVVTSPLEHPAVLEPLRRLASFGVIELSEVEVEHGTGRVTPQAVERVLRADTVLVAIMAAHNELGTLNDVQAIARLAHQVGAHVHCDAVQAAGKVPLAAITGAVDTLAVSAHKLYGPKGVGALYVRPGLELYPVIEGGGQERGLRSGTENVPGIVGFGVAAELAAAELAAEARRLEALREALYEGLARHAGDRLQRNSPRTGSLPNTLHVSVRGMDATAMLAELDRAGIAASSGSACHAGAGHATSALRLAGLDAEALHGTLRLSLGRSSSPEAIARTAEAFGAALERCLD